MIRGSPSTSSVSLENARRRSRVRAFASSARVRLAACGVSSSRRCANATSMSICAYQTSRLLSAANSRIAVRYRATVASTAVRRCLAENPRSRPATAMLAESRLTSHSQGPGSVSSKSLRSNASRRSGVPKTPKFERCASPHNCTCSPVRGTWERSEAMISAAPRKNAKGETSIRP